jgi:hypothetical protein
MHLILVAQEAEIGRIEIGSQPGKKLSRLYLNQ